MKKSTFFTFAAAALLASTSAAMAAAPEPELVTPGDTFTFDISGFNATSGVGYVLGTGGLTATFGDTETFAAAGANGQAYTITTGEAVNGLTTTDTFTVTTPTNFLTSTTVNGTKITALQFDIGDANSGVGVTTGANTVDYSLPVTGNTTAGTYTYSGGTFSFTTGPTATLTNSNESLSLVEGINSGTTAISNYAFKGFSFSITYNTIPALVPEPSTYAAAAVGALALGIVLQRRNRRSAVL